MKIQTVLDDDLRWPNRCAKCGSSDQLILAKVKISKTVFTTYLIATVASTETLTLSYPSCRAHAFATWLAGLVTSTRVLATMVRVLFYLFCLTVVFSWIFASMRYPLTLPPVPLLIVVVGMAGIIWSRKWLPVRLAKFDEGVLDLVFSDDRYAQEFVSLNPEHTDKEVTRRSPWYDSRNWGTIGFYLLIVIGFVWLLVAALRAR
jgi:hypothetical protein